MTMECWRPSHKHSVVSPHGRASSFCPVPYIASALNRLLASRCKMDCATTLEYCLLSNVTTCAREESLCLVNLDLRRCGTLGPSDRTKPRESPSSCRACCQLGESNPRTQNH